MQEVNSSYEAIKQMLSQANTDVKPLTNDTIVMTTVKSKIDFNQEMTMMKQAEKDEKHIIQGNIQVPPNSIVNEYFLKKI